MKTTKLFLPVLFTLSLFLCSCDAVPTVNDPDLMSLQNMESNFSMNASEVSISTNTITSADSIGLLLMREEEKMARDVYSYFFDKYKLRIFNNIAKSEQVHTNAVLYLLKKFNITDPAYTEVGKFQDADLQSLYTKFSSEASTINMALSTGAYIEEYDIADLQKLIAETNNADIKRVYSNLLRGSVNHLRAFTGVLAARKVVYKPTILSQEIYDSIVSKK